MEIAELVVETISHQYRNRFPHPNAPGPQAFHGRDVTTFLHKYESLAIFTATDVTESSVIAMLPYYCTEEIRETVMMMRGYTDCNLYAFQTELLDAFRHSDSRALVYTRRYLEELCTSFGGHHKDFGSLEQIECLKSFLTQFDHFSGVLIARGMTCEYERTEMLLHTLPKKLWKKAISKLEMYPLEPTEALAIFEFMAPNSHAATEMTPSTTPALTTSAFTSSSASLTSASMMAPTASMTAPTASTTPMASASPAPTDMTAAIPTASTAPTTSPALPDSAAAIAPMAPPTVVTSPARMASTASTPLARTHTARQGTIRAGPMVRLGIIRIEPPQGQKICRHHYAQPESIRPHRSKSTVTCRREPTPSNRPKPRQPRSQEPVTPNRQETIKLPRSERIVPSHNQPVPPPCQEPVQPLQQVNRPPCYYCADDQHNLRKCTDLPTDLGKGIISINNRDRLVVGTAGADIPMALAARDYCTMRDYARAGAPILLPPSPSPSPPPFQVPSLEPSPASQPAPLQTPPPARPSRLPVPLLSPEQLTQLMREVSEHFARSWQYGVDVSPPPPPPPSPPPAAQLSRISVPLPSPEQLIQLVREVTEHFAQARPGQTARPPPAARKARKLEQRRSLCV
ncbi:hypothetical protein K440DRAFT_664156 [Wilcoxina mikolae CBS 423.85]|nr:hypothetical protein K440DRAFT_664156 [Wilcoxina mikolae CBS 423.85]